MIIWENFLSLLPALWHKTRFKERMCHSTTTTQNRESSPSISNTYNQSANKSMKHSLHYKNPHEIAISSLEWQIVTKINTLNHKLFATNSLRIGRLIFPLTTIKSLQVKDSFIREAFKLIKNSGQGPQIVIDAFSSL